MKIGFSSLQNQLIGGVLSMLGKFEENRLPAFLQLPKNQLIKPF
jgi:hypothetical protein